MNVAHVYAAIGAGLPLDAGDRPTILRSVPAPVERPVLAICGLEYRVVVATADEVPELAGREGFTSCGTNTIFLSATLPPSRMKDALVHEVLHAFFEASGIGSFIEGRVRGDYDRFEETLIRLLVPALLRLVEQNPGIAA